MLKGGTTKFTLKDKHGNTVEQTHTTQDYDTGTYLIINNNPSLQGSVRVKSYTYHKKLRGRIKKNGYTLLDDESTSLSLMKPPRKVVQRFKEDIDVEYQCNEGVKKFPYKGKHVLNLCSGEFYVVQPFMYDGTSKSLIPKEGLLQIYEKKTGRFCYDLGVDKINQVKKEDVKNKLLALAKPKNGETRETRLTTIINDILLTQWQQEQ